MNKKDRVEVLFEHMSEKFDLMMEYVKLIPEIIITQKEHSEDIQEIKGDIKVIKAVVSDHSRDIAYLKSKVG